MPIHCLTLIDVRSALELLCKAAKRAMFGLQRRCQQLKIQDPVLKYKLFNTLEA